MRALVTGGAGFIGSHLVHALLEGGHSVRVIDDLSTGNIRRLSDVLDETDWMEADICDQAAAARAAAGIEVIFHQAAIPSVARSLKNPLASNQANVTGTLTLLEAARNAGVRRLVYAASSSEYGRNPALPKVETMRQEPMSPYAVSKLAGEFYCQAYAHLGYVETVCLRYFNVFGPAQDPESQYAAVIPRFICALLADQPITVDGTGEQSRDFTYVANVVQANLLAASTPGVSGESFNVGCGERHDLNALVAELAAITGKTPRVHHGPARAGDVPHSLADISKARNLLSYEPSITFGEGLRLTVNWYREHLNT